MAAQLLHAAGESSPGNLPSSTFAVCLAAPDELALLKLEARLVAEGIPHTAIREPDAPWNNALMSIGFPPQDRIHLKKYLSNFPLLK